MGKGAHDKDWRGDPLENMTPVCGNGSILKDHGNVLQRWSRRRALW
jgi:ribosomal protein S27AE